MPASINTLLTMAIVAPASLPDLYHDAACSIQSCGELGRRTWAMIDSRSK